MPARRRLYHMFQCGREISVEHYRWRSNVESTFSMVRRKFGDSLRSKTKTAQVNEVLCKVLAHNLCCLVQSMYEFGVDVEFGAEG